MKLFGEPTNSAPPHRPGFITVVVGSRGAIALTSGTRLSWGERLFGGYSTYYQVDVRRTAVDLPKFQSQSQQAGLDFDVTAQVSVEVVDAARVVQSGISDMTSALRQLARRVADEHAAKFEVANANGAKRAIEAALAVTKFENGVKISGASVDVRPDAEATALLRRVGRESLVIKANQADANINRASVTDIIRLFDNPNELLAHSIVTKDPAFNTALELKLRQFENDRSRQYEFLKMLIDKGIVEGHELHGKYGHIVDEALEALRPQIAPVNQTSLPGLNKPKS